MSKKLFTALFLAGILAFPTTIYGNESTTLEATTMEAEISSSPKSIGRPATRPLQVKPINPAESEMVETAVMMPVDTKSTQAKDEMKEKIEAAREKFKEKLATIKDQKKQNVATKVDTKISTLNTKFTTQLTDKLNKFSEVLTRVITKEALMKSEGKSTTVLASEIADANEAIDEARDAIAKQSEKGYVMTITTESGLKNSASTVVKQFMTDIKATRKTVMDAKDAVKKAFITSNQLNNAKTTSITPTLTEIQ